MKHWDIGCRGSPPQPGYNSICILVDYYQSCSDTPAVGVHVVLTYHLCSRILQQGEENLSVLVCVSASSSRGSLRYPDLYYRGIPTEGAFVFLPALRQGSSRGSLRCPDLCYRDIPAEGVPSSYLCCSQTPAEGSCVILACVAERLQQRAPGPHLPV